MIFREAIIEDIPEIQVVRHSVKENRLSNPALVSDEDCRQFITLRGKGWVCEIEHQIAGFAIADLQDNNIWALFLRPEFEKRGIGKQLHDLMLDWYFLQDKTYAWLSTEAGTRAETFYRKCGWTQQGMHKQELRFEIRAEKWKEIKNLR